VTAAAAINFVDIIDHSLYSRRFYCAAESNYHHKPASGTGFRRHPGWRFAPARAHFSVATARGMFLLGMWDPFGRS
jgi:hypothetical protein